MPRVLIANDNPGVLQTLVALLKSEDIEITAAEAFDQASAAVDNERFDVMVADLSIGDSRGLELVERACRSQKGLALVAISDTSTVDEALAAMKCGIFDYLTKPIKPTEFLDAMRNACAVKSEASLAADLPTPLKHKCRLDTILAESNAMKRVCDLIEQVAPTDVHLLITGQGFEEIDRVIYTIHRLGSRHIKQIITADCTDLKDEELFGRAKKGFLKGAGHGLLEQAEGSVLHLQNIEALALDIQEKLLVAVTEGRYQKGDDETSVPLNVRLVFSSSKDLAARAASGELLPELYTRISVVSIDVPSLRDRPEDVLPLLDYIAHTEIGYEGELSVTREAASYLERYAWPGEIEELRRTVRYCLDRSNNGIIKTESLPQQLHTGSMRAKQSSVEEDEDARLANLKAFLHQYQEVCLSRIIAA